MFLHIILSCVAILLPTHYKYFFSLLINGHNAMRGSMASGRVAGGGTAGPRHDSTAGAGGSAAGGSAAGGSPRVRGGAAGSGAAASLAASAQGAAGAAGRGCLPLMPEPHNTMIATESCGRLLNMLRNQQLKACHTWVHMCASQHLTSWGRH